MFEKISNNKYLKFSVLLLIVFVVCFIVYKKRKNVSGVENTGEHKYKLGDKYKDGGIDFDTDGMIEAGKHARVTWSVENLFKLYQSFVDLNFHKEAEPLGKALNHLESANKRIKQFNALCEEY